MPSTVQLAPIDARALNAWTILDVAAVQNFLTGSTTETTLATITLPAGAMGANGILRISSVWTMNSNANNKTLRHRLGGTAIAQLPLASPNIFYVANTLFRNRNAQNSQIVMPLNAAGGMSSSAGALVSTAIDTSLSQSLTLTGQLANAGDQIALEAYFVELFYGA